MTAGDLLDDFKELLGACSDDRAFAQMTDAVETLSNEMWQDPSGNWRSWDALEGYLVATVQQDNLLVLPGDVETPIRLNINSQPAFSRDKFYEFSPNGFGSVAGDQPVSAWQDAGYSPTSKLLDGVVPVKFRASGSGLFITGEDPNGARVENYPVPTGYDTQTFLRVDSVNKLGMGSLTLYGTPNGGSESTYGLYGPKDNSPSYKVLRLSKSGASVRMLYRRKTFRITSAQDFIFLNSRLAVLYMAKAIRRGLTEDFTAQEVSLYGRAVDLLKKEQLSRVSADLVAPNVQVDRSLNLNMRARDVTTVFDVYDECATILGQVGQQQVFDAISQACDVLSNAPDTAWNSELCFADVIGDGFVFTLPREVGEVISVNVCGQPAQPRNRWIEFSLNGPGQFWPFVVQQPS